MVSGKGTSHLPHMTRIMAVETSSPPEAVGPFVASLADLEIHHLVAHGEALLPANTETNFNHGG
jgi:hypothetical protein